MRNSRGSDAKDSILSGHFEMQRTVWASLHACVTFIHVGAAAYRAKGRCAAE